MSSSSSSRGWYDDGRTKRGSYQHGLYRRAGEREDDREYQGSSGRSMYDHHNNRTRRRTSPAVQDQPSPSRSPSPDPQLQQFLSEQARPVSPNSEAYRVQRLAAGGVLNVKSRRQKEAEEAERKAKEAEEDVALAYRAFIKDMEGGGSTRESTARKAQRRTSTAFVRADNSSYMPAERIYERFQTVSDYSAPKKAGDQSRSTVAEKEDSVEKMTEKDPKGVTGKRKSGVMQDFIGELQRGQAQREERLKARIGENDSISALLAREQRDLGSREEHDPNSTNVCIRNLPANVSEHSLGQHFNFYGDIASVKIMWPRSEEPLLIYTEHGQVVRTTRREGATGFVNYMTRSDAQLAFNEIEGVTWKGSILRTGWGKSLPKPDQPLFRRLLEMKHVSGDGNKESQSESSGRRGSSPSAQSCDVPARRSKRMRRERSNSPTALLSERVRHSKGEDMVRTIRSVAMRVREHGADFENRLRQDESSDARLGFLRDCKSDEGQLYKCLVDDSYAYTLELPSFNDEGYTSMYSSDSEEGSEWERLSRLKKTDVLGPRARERLDAMLRGLTMRRERIANVMCFAIQHASYAETIAKRLVHSLLLPQTPLPRKLARLYAVSDVLHNASASTHGAWRYRSLLEAQLDRVFLHWGDVANSFGGRIKRETCKDMARTVLTVWESWLVFDAARLGRWRTCVECGSGRTDASVLEDTHEEGIRRLSPHLDDDSQQLSRADPDEDIDGEAMLDEHQDDEHQDESNESRTQKVQLESIDGASMTDISKGGLKESRAGVLLDVEQEDIDGEAMPLM